MAGSEPVRHVSTIALADLQEIEPQKGKIERNTEHFVCGLPANNVLLTDARGTGKSSLIKACLNAYAPQGLRLIEVDKDDLVDLPDIVELVAQRPEKFIVFADDLSFESGEPGYKALKSILDGSVSAASDNLLIYATSNRRHLPPETMKDNLGARHGEDGELHRARRSRRRSRCRSASGSGSASTLQPGRVPERGLAMAVLLRRARIEFDAARPQALVWALERARAAVESPTSSRAITRRSRRSQRTGNRSGGVSGCWWPTATGRARAVPTVRSPRSRSAC